VAQHAHVSWLDVELPADLLVAESTEELPQHDGTLPWIDQPFYGLQQRRGSFLRQQALLQRVGLTVGQYEIEILFT
jgi:hypothetical protein